MIYVYYVNSMYVQVFNVYIYIYMFVYVYACIYQTFGVSCA